MVPGASILASPERTRQLGALKPTSANPCCLPSLVISIEYDMADSSC
jgi:hypothetical protein